MELKIKLPDEIAQKVRDRDDRDEFMRYAVTLALEDETRSLPAHLTISPGIAGGKPRIAGHRITIQDIVTWHELQGRNVDEISADYGLSLGEIHAALAYYFDHREEIDAALREREAFIELLRSQTPSKLQQRLKERALRGEED